MLIAAMVLSVAGMICSGLTLHYSLRTRRARAKMANRPQPVYIVNP